MEKSVLLAIDSSGPRLQLGLVVGDKITSYVEEIARGHAEILFARIKTLFGKSDVLYDDLTRIAVTTGPGSFTGLRVGIAAARAIGMASNIPVIGVPTLLAMSLGGPMGNAFSVTLDARRGETYFQDFVSPGEPLGDIKLVTNEEVANIGNIVTPGAVDIELMARFALNVHATDFPPDPTYIRSADAKPQTKNIVQRADGPSL